MPRRIAWGRCCERVSSTKRPTALPKGEALLWQGRPAWWPLAVRAFHVRKVALYFALFMAWRFASIVVDGGTLLSASLAALWLLVPGGISVGVLCGLALALRAHHALPHHERRVLMQFGVALPMTFNVPFRIIGAAELKTYADGTGDIPLALTGKERAAYLLLWPHARPWRAAAPSRCCAPCRMRSASPRLLSKALLAASDESASAGRSRRAVAGCDQRTLAAVAA